MKELPTLEPYVPVYQNNHINAFAYLTPQLMKGKDIYSKLDDDGYYEIRYNDTQFFFRPSYIAVTGRTQQLMMFYIEKFTRSIRHGCSDEEALAHKKIRFQVSEVAKEFNLTTKQARKMIIKSSTAMQLMIIQWEDNLRGKIEQHSSNILQGFVYYKPNRCVSLKRGEVTVTLADDFATLLPKLYIMWYPRNLRRIPLRRYPSANAFAVKLSVTYNMNFGKESCGKLAVPALLLSTQDIPSYDKLQDKLEHGTRQLQKRIITPFVRTLDVLVEYGVLSDWHMEFDGEVLAREALKGIRYKMFRECKVVYGMMDYPEEKRMKALATSKTVSASKSKTPMARQNLCEVS